MIAAQAGLEGFEGFEGFEIEGTAEVGAENGLSIVATLGDVARRSDDDETLFSGHCGASVLLKADACKWLRYKEFLNSAPVPDLPLSRISHSG